MELNKIESKLFGRICYGFTRREDGIVILDEKKSEVVRSIFKMYREGNSLENIQKKLYEEGIPSPSGNPRWTRDVIDKVLTNGKYTREIVSFEDFVDVQFMKEKACRYCRI